MPLYSYYCKPCDKSKVEIRTVAQSQKRDLLPTCDSCGGKMRFEISGPPMAIVKNPAAGYSR